MSGRGWKHAVVIVAVATLGLPAAALTAGGAGADTALTSVSTPTVVLSSTAQGAAATYTVGFATSASGALGPGTTVTLVAPAGTLFPPGNCNYTITDVTTPAASDGCTAGYGIAGVKTASPGLPIYNFLSASGSAVTITLPGNNPTPIGAGDALTLTVASVVNPAPGSGTIAVSTSADVAPSTSAPYTITAGSSVSTPSVALGSLAAGATTTYTVGFTASATGSLGAGGAITPSAPSGSITLVAPGGTLFPSNNCNYTVTDTTTPGASWSCPAVHFASSGLPIYGFEAASGSVVTLSEPNAGPSAGIGAGDQITVTVKGVVNAAAGSRSLRVSTSADTVPATSAPITLAAAQAVTGLAASTSTAGAGTSATYTIGFTSSTSGALAGGGTITLAAPPGTVWPADRCQYTLTDATNPSQDAGCSTQVIQPTFAAGGSVVSLAIPTSPAAGDALTLTVPTVTNPGAGTHTMTLSTSADLVPAVSAGYTITGSPVTLTSVTGASLAASTSAAGGTGVTYSIGFTATSTITGSTGNLPNVGSVSLVAPPGTIFGPCPYGCGGGNATYTFTDATNSAGTGGGTPAVAGGSAVAVTPVNTINAGDVVTLTITQATNPISSGTLALSTSADPAPVNVADTVVAARAVSGVTLGTSTPAGGANGVTYTVGFTTSATGALVGGLGAVTLAAPAGTIFGTCPYGCGGGNPTVTFSDLTNPSASGNGSMAGNAANGTTVSLVPPNTIAAGDSVTLTITQVTNPFAPGGPVTVSTSSDPTAVSVADPTVSPTSVGAPTFFAGDSMGGATTTYTAGFVASANGALGGGLGAITVSATPGTNLGTATSVTVTDATNPSGSGSVDASAVVAGGSIESYTVRNTIAAGDHATLTIVGATNPASGAPTVSVSTSSDPVVVAPEQLATLDGTVTFGGNAVPGAALQACPTGGGACATGTSDPSGAFSLGVPATPGGTFAITAYPPATGVVAGPVTVGPFTISGLPGLTGISVVLAAPPALDAGVTLQTPGGALSSSTSNPRLYWGDPIVMTVAPGNFGTGTTFITQVTAVGVDSVTGQVVTSSFAPGGTATASGTGTALSVNLPVAAGSPIVIPPLAPTHGAVQLYTTSVTYDSPPSFAPGAVGYNPIVSWNAAGDRLSAIVNNGVVGGLPIGSSSISGPNAADFALIVPKTIDTGWVPCDAVTLDQNGAGTGPGTVGCENQIRWAPNGTDHIETATLVVDAGGTPIPIQLTACNPAVAPCGGGGPSSTSSSGAGWGAGTGGSGGVYVDPSGTVVTTEGLDTVPVPGATVTLNRQDPTTGLYSAVPDGSALMSPDNRANPDATNAAGEFGWDTLAGTYRVDATANGCTLGSSPDVTVPPPATDLTIALACSAPPARGGTTTALTPSANPVMLGASLGLTAHVIGSSPSGTVSFADGSTVLGTAPVDAGGNASFAVATLAGGPHSLSATYNGDGLNLPSTSPTVDETVTVPQVAVSTNAALSSSANPSVLGQSVTFTAAVTPTSGSGTPTGSVTFTVGGVTQSAVTLVNGQAALTTSSLPVGPTTIGASYGGDADYTGSTADDLTQTVDAHGAAATVTATGGTPQSTPVGTAFGAPLTVKVADTYGNSVPGANVTFTAPASGASATFGNSTAVTTVPTGADGTASSGPVTANGTAGGPYTVIATVGPLHADFSLTNTPSTPPGGADLSIGITDLWHFFAHGTYGLYLVPVTNTGTAPTSGTITVTDRFTSQLRGVAAIGQSFRCTTTTSKATCTRTTALAPGETAWVFVLVVVQAPRGASVTDTVRVAPTDATPGANTATDRTWVLF